MFKCTVTVVSLFSADESARVAMPAENKDGEDDVSVNIDGEDV